jgi:hypothetical protein
MFFSQQFKGIFLGKIQESLFFQHEIFENEFITWQTCVINVAPVLYFRNLKQSVYLFIYLFNGQNILYIYLFIYFMGKKKKF